MDRTIYFRSFEEKDADLIYEWMNDDNLKKYSVGLNRRLCKEEALDWVKARMKHDLYQVWWAICSKDNDTLIGYTYISNIHYINSSANFGGLIIGDPNYRDGTAWIESYMFVLEYAFERLNLNRLYGTYIEEHPATGTMQGATFFKREGLLRQAIFKNGKYHDEVMTSLLASEYYEHLNAGDYSYKAILKRVLKLLKSK